MKRTLIAAAAFLAFSAHATCGFRGIPNEQCGPNGEDIPPAASPSTVTSQSAAAAAAAAQARSRSASRSASRSESQGGSGVVTIQGAQAGSGDTYDGRTWVLPSLPSLPPVIIPGAASTSIFVPCGPLLAKWPKPIEVNYHDLTGHEVRYQGMTWDFGMAVDYGGDIFHTDASGALWGNSALVIHTVVSTGSTRQFSLGGGDGKSWGQGGMGSGGANQQLVKDVTILPCQIAVKAAAPAPAAKVAVYVKKTQHVRRAPLPARECPKGQRPVTQRICVPV